MVETARTPWEAPVLEDMGDLNDVAFNPGTDGDLGSAPTSNS